MKFRIHGTWPNGSEDSIIVEGDDIDEIREKAKRETDDRNWSNLWSENLED